MFGIDGSEFLLFAIVALVVIGPKDLPKAMRVVGKFVAKARAMSRHFQSGLDAMIRESELEEMEKKWKAENERIMREHSAHLAPPADPTVMLNPPPPDESDTVLPPTPEPAPARPQT